MGSLTLLKVRRSDRYSQMLAELSLASKGAFEKCKRLHRDISHNNVILVWKKGKGRRVGFLGDWEFSCKTDCEGRARDYARSVSHNRPSLWDTAEHHYREHGPSCP